MSNLPRYRVQFVTGDYSARQAEANRLGADLYIEGHANSSPNPAADYAMCVVSTNASQTSKHLAAWLALAWGKALDVGGDRDSDIGYGNGYRVGGAGDGNLRHTDMPAVLVEPCFASNRVQARAVETGAGMALVASILVEGIRDLLPADSLIVFSVGHHGKTSQPYDRGARWRGDLFGTEAEFAAHYLHLAAAMLREGRPTSPVRTLRELRLLPGDAPVVSRETAPAARAAAPVAPEPAAPMPDAPVTAAPLLSFVLARLKEPTTWRGLVWLMTAAGVAVSPDQLDAIVAAGMAVAGAIAVFTSDPGSRPDAPV